MAKKSNGTKHVLVSEQRMLDVEIDDAEMQEMGEALAEKLGLLEQLDISEKAFKERLKEERAPLEAETHRLGREMRAGKRRELVPVEVVADYAKGTAITTRLDTHEEINERMLTNDERQVPMPLASRGAVHEEVRT